MMRVITFKVIDVQRHQCVIDETLEKFAREIDIEFADACAHEINFHIQPGTARQINDHT